MTDHGFSESVVEQAALAWLESMSWTVLHGPDIAPAEFAAERSEYSEVALERRLRDSRRELQGEVRHGIRNGRADLWRQGCTPQKPMPR